MKKRFSLLLMLMLIISMVFSGCGSNSSSEENTGTETETSTASTDNDGESTKTSEKNVEETAEETTKEDAKSVLDEEMTLSYMAWNLGTEEENNLERQMLARFDELYPNATIEIVEVPLNEDGTAGDYGAYLQTLAAKKDLPDVFMWTSVPDTAADGWSADISEFATADEDFQNVVETMRNGTLVNGKVFAVPYQMHLFGLIFNADIFNEMNVNLPDYNYSLEELTTMISETTSDVYKGTENLAIEDWGAMALSDTIGFGTFDGEKYNFDSPEFAQAIEIYKGMVERGEVGHGRYSEPWLPEGVSWAWGEGYVAVQYDASWSVAGMMNGNVGVEGDMYPLANEKVVIVPDFVYIADNSEHKEAAYELAKFMSFGLDGTLERIAIREAEGIDSYYGLPLTAGYNEEIDNYFLSDYEDFPMFQQIYRDLKEKPENSYLEGYKIVPGYAQSRFTADTGIIGNVDGTEKSLTIEELVFAMVRGEKSVADYGAEINKIANKHYEEAKVKVAGK